jgi:hypothetical protein
MPESDASQSTKNSLVKSSSCSAGAVVNAVLSESNVVAASGVQWNASLLRS